MSRLIARINAHEQARQERECAKGNHPHVLKSRYAHLSSVCLCCRRPV